MSKSSSSHQLSPQQHSALIRPLEELRKVLDEASRLVEDDIPSPSAPPAPGHTRSRTLSTLPTLHKTKSTWFNHKPSLPRLVRPSSASAAAPEFPKVPVVPMDHRPLICRGSERSVSSPPIVSEGTSTTRGSSFLDKPPPTSVLKRFRNELHDYRVRTTASASAPVPAPVPLASDQVPIPPGSHRRARTPRRPFTSPTPISSDKGMAPQQIPSTTCTGSSSAHLHKTKTKTKHKLVYRTSSSLSLAPLVYTQLVSEDDNKDGGVGNGGGGGGRDAALVRPRRPKTADGSNLGRSDMRTAAQRGKPEGKIWHGVEAVGEMMKMVRIMM